MVAIVLFHSVYGLRTLERDAAARLAAAGHDVHTPDLYAGRIAETIDEGFAIKDQIGWPTLCDRAEKSIATLPASTVLGGFSMGAGIASSLWPRRPDTSGLLFLHGIAGIAENARKNLPLQVHLADPDDFEPADEVAAWQTAVERAGLALELFRYPGPGHLYTDRTLPDYDAAAAEKTWERVIRFLDTL